MFVVLSCLFYGVLLELHDFSDAYGACLLLWQRLIISCI